MKRFLLVVCVFAGLCLLLFPTTGAPSAQSPTTDDLQLSATSAHDGAYTSATDGEQLQIRVGHGERGLNDEAITTIDSVFEITYTGPGSATVWLEAPVSGVQFYRGPNPGKQIDDKETMTMTSGDAVRVGILLDTTQTDSPLAEFDVFRVGIRGVGTDSADDTKQIPVDPAGSTDGGGAEGTPAEGGPSDPDDTPTDPGGDQQDGSEDPPTADPPPDIPDIPLPNIDPGSIFGDGVGPGGAGPDQRPGGGGTTAGSVTEPGTAPDTTQTSLASVRWILLLVSGVICGALGGVALRRLVSGEMS